MSGTTRAAAALASAALAAATFAAPAAAATAPQRADAALDGPAVAGQQPADAAPGRPAVPAAATDPAAAAGPRGAAAARRVVRVAPRRVQRGRRILVTGRGWPARARVTLMIGPPESEAVRVRAVRASGRGTFRARLRLRAQPGPYVLLACMRSCAVKEQASFRVAAGRGRGTTTLLHTELPQAGYRERPRALGYRRGTALRLRLHSLLLDGLRWKGWGGASARSGARALLCRSASDCDAVRAQVVATRRVRYESREWFYARAVVRLRRAAAGVPRTIELCTLPAICGGPGGPP